MDEGENLGDDVDLLAATALVMAPWAGPAGGSHDSRLTPIGPAEATPELEPGRRLGRYVIVKKIGRGGMGTVYAAYDPELDRNLALKLVAAGVGGEGHHEHGRARLLREAQAIASLSHPNVVAIHDVGLWEQHVVIAMEFIEGQSLREWSASQRPWREVIDVYIQAARGLEAAHRVGLVHRDFKPDNALVGRDGRVRVADFGLARPSAGSPSDQAALEPTSESPVDPEIDPKLTQTGTTLGTPAYMSPEQHRCEPVDARSDQFSFCVALWEGLYGGRPFSGRTLGELARQTAACEIEARSGGRRVPSTVRRVLLRGLSPRPELRFARMGDLVEALRRSQRRVRAGKIAAWGGLVAGVFALVAIPRASNPEAPRCEVSQAAARLTGVWDEDVRARVETALLGSDRAYAPDTWTRVEAALDEYAEAWTSAHVDACRATHLRAEHPPQWLDERMRCLDRRLEEARRLTAKLMEAGPDVVAVAGLRVRELPAVSSCERDSMEDQRPVPDDRTLREMVTRQRALLETAQDLEQAKNAEGARALVQEVLVRARADSYPPLEAEALLSLATLEEDLDHDMAQSAAHYQRAVGIALAADYDDAVARAWVGLVGNATRRERPREAHMWAGYAERVLDRSPSPGVEQQLEGALTWLGVAEEDNDAALLHAQRSLEIVEANFGPEHPRAIVALNLVSVAHYYGHRKDEARACLERALAIAEKIHGPKHPALSAPLNNIGVILTDQKQYDQAVAYYERSLAIREATLDERHPHLHQAYDNLAELLHRDGQIERALEFAERTVVLADAADVDMQSRIKAIHRVGLLHLERGDAPSAEPHIHRAIMLWEALPMEQRGAFLDARYRFAQAWLDWEFGLDRRQARAVAETSRAALEAGGTWHADEADRVQRWLRSHR